MTLRQQLDETPLDQLTTELVRAALTERIGEMTDYHHMDPDAYWPPEVLPEYRRAAAWWPLDAPPQHALPALSYLVHAVANVQPVTETALSLLLLAGQRCVSWLLSEGRDPAHPNETRQQAQRRRAAGAMRRSRQLTRAARDNPAALRVRELHAAYMAACAARKAAVEAVREEHDPLVMHAMAEWRTAKADLASGVLDAGGGLVDAVADD